MPNNIEGPLPQRATHLSLLQAKLIKPVLALLRHGARPERLAWSLAVGIAIGINPLLGSTTLLCLLVAFLLRLNIVASQLTNHLMYPLEILLLLPFIRIGERLFHTQHMPIVPSVLLHAARLDPIKTTKLLWMWEWHAMVAWALLSVLLVPAIALPTVPLLRHALRNSSIGAQPGACAAEQEA